MSVVSTLLVIFGTWFVVAAVITGVWLMVAMRREDLDARADLDAELRDLIEHPYRKEVNE